jgi:hypothetical protein
MHGYCQIQGCKGSSSAACTSIGRPAADGRGVGEPLAAATLNGFPSMAFSACFEALWASTLALMGEVVLRVDFT